MLSTEVNSASNNILADHSLKLNLEMSGAGTLAHTLTIQNNSQDIIDSVAISFPSTNITRAKYTYRGLTYNAEQTKVGDTLLVTAYLSPDVIKPGSKAKVTFTIDAGNVVDSRFGMYQLYLPDLNSSEAGTRKYQVEITFPQAFPPLAYASDSSISQSGNRIILSEAKDYLLIWGQSLNLGLVEEIKLKSPNTEASSLINIPYIGMGQQALFPQFGQVENAYTDNLSNLWVSIGKEASLNYSSTVSKQIVTRDRSLIENFELTKVDLSSSIPNLGLRTSLDVYKFMSNTYTPNYKITNQNLDWKDLRTKLLQSQIELSVQEYTILTAALLEEVGVPNRIVYGYLVGEYYPGYQSDSPHAWVEYTDEKGELWAMDPYLGDVTGYDFGKFRSFPRIVYGIWQPNSHTDSMIGLLSDGIKHRPEFVEIGPAQQDGYLNLNLDQEKLGPIPAGREYSLVAVIENYSNQFVELQEVTLDNSFLLDVNSGTPGGFSQAVAPNNSHKFRISGLYSENYLTTGEYIHTVKLTTNLDSVTTSLAVDFVIAEQPYLVGFGGLIILLSISIIGLLTLGLSYKKKGLDDVVESDGPGKSEQRRVNRLPI